MFFQKIELFFLRLFMTRTVHGVNTTAESVFNKTLKYRGISKIRALFWGNKAGVRYNTPVKLAAVWEASGFDFGNFVYSMQWLPQRGETDTNGAPVPAHT